MQSAYETRLKNKTPKVFRVKNLLSPHALAFELHAKKFLCAFDFYVRLVSMHVV